LIGKPNLFEVARATRNTQLMEKKERWYELPMKNDFVNLAELREVFPSVDRVQEESVFNRSTWVLIV
jgi:HigB_toxin, RelE-like toxic component of a toxin-antitoxin system